MIYGCMRYAIASSYHVFSYGKARDRVVAVVRIIMYELLLLRSMFSCRSSVNKTTFDSESLAQELPARHVSWVGTLDGQYYA